MPVELDSVYFVTCPKQGLEMKAVVLGFQTLGGTPMTNHGSSTPLPPPPA